MSEFEDITIFDKKTMADVFKDIYNSAKKRRTDIEKMIDVLTPLVVNAGDAVIVVPLISKYLDSGISNDDNIIKMLSIVQKATTRAKEKGSDEPELSKEERQALLVQFQEYSKKL